MPPQPGGQHPGAVDKVVNLDLTFVRSQSVAISHLFVLTALSLRQNGTFFQVNGTAFISPKLPVLLQILSGAHNAHTLMPEGGVIGLPGHSSIEVTIPGGVVGGGVSLLLWGIHHVLIVNVLLNLCSAPFPPPWREYWVIFFRVPSIESPSQHNFYVIRSAGNNATNYINPPIRDVVNIGGLGDDVTIRFYTDNPGPWFLHW
jgi:iron transport multicopper oxidase